MVNSSVLRRAGDGPLARPGDTWRTEACFRRLPNNKNRTPRTTQTLSDAASRAGIAGGIAQLVERRLCKPDVAGSSPTASTTLADGSCVCRGHWPFGFGYGRVAQLVRASH